MDQAKLISLKIHMILGLVIATCVVLGVYVMGLFGIHMVWPAFFIMISFFLMGADVKNLPTIMIERFRSGFCIPAVHGSYSAAECDWRSSGNATARLDSCFPYCSPGGSTAACL